MINRLSEIVPDIKAAVQEAGWDAIEGERVLLRITAEGTRHSVDAKEHTGPIYWPNLRDWMERLGEGRQILMTMGFYPQTAIGKLLHEREFVDRVALVEMGMRNFFDTEFRPQKFGLTNTPVFSLIEETFAAKGIQMRDVTCSYCSSKPLICCQVCGALACGSHFIPCPLCGVHFCHPDVNRCYFDHRC